MSYLALYRKYRPTRFEDVSGQNTPVKIFKNQIASGRIGHAYLLSGIRGTGKTTLAKIFARAVNCEHPIDGSPCGECDTCRALSSGANMDIIEIDAASNRGVDEIRDLREKVKYPPSIGRYKVYIIDEVHMLTKEAFNALLKTLEEPPEHAIFILATTEPARLPETIRSRCQHFEIRPISDDLIEERMREICGKENIVFDEDSFKILARRARHSMRDGLSLLDQASDLEPAGTLIHAEEVRDLLGVAREEGLKELARAHAKHDSEALMETLRKMRQGGISESLLVEDLVRYYRDLILIRVGGPADEEDREIASLFGPGELYHAVDVLSEAFQKMRLNSLSDVLTDMALLSLVEEGLQPVQAAPAQVQRTVSQPKAAARAESRQKSAKAAQTPAKQAVTAETPKAKAAAEQEPAKAAEPAQPAGEKTQPSAENATPQEKPAARPKASMAQVKERVLGSLSGFAKGVVTESEFQYAAGTFYLVLKREGWDENSRMVKNAEGKIREALIHAVGRNVKLQVTTLAQFKQLAREMSRKAQSAPAEPAESGKAPAEASQGVHEESAEYDTRSIEERVREILPGDYTWKNEKTT